MSTSCLPLQRASGESREGEGREGSVDEEEAEAGDEHSRVVRGSAEKKRKEVRHAVRREPMPAAAHGRLTCPELAAQ